jgi:hypothetical protein
MLDLIINSKGVTAQALILRLETHGHEVHTLMLPKSKDEASIIKAHFDAIAEEGKHYTNIYLNLTDSECEISDFNLEPKAAITAIQTKLKAILKALKYGTQHLARADGGRIFVMCYDHSVNISIDAPSTPITNNAVTAAVQSLAKEVARFGVTINIFLMHPPKESLLPAQWRAAKNDLKVYSMKYKPAKAEDLSEIMHMYAEVNHLTTTGGVIPLSSGIAACNI